METLKDAAHGVLDKIKKDQKIIPNKFKCNICGEKKAFEVNGNEIQPCPSCQIAQIEATMGAGMKMERAGSQLDEKYNGKGWSDYRVINDEQKKMINMVKWWVQHFEKNWWIVLMGNQGTGKTFVKNLILAELKSKKISFVNTTSYDMFVRFGDTIRLSGSIDELREYYCSRDVLCIDEVGREQTTEAYRNFLFDITNKMYSKNKAMIIVSNLLLKTEDGKSISDYFDYDRICERAKVVGFTWASYRTKEGR